MPVLSGLKLEPWQRKKQQKLTAMTCLLYILLLSCII